MKNILFLLKKVVSLFEKIVSPKSKFEDSQRREFIFNVLLLSLIALSIIASGITILQSVTLETYKGLSPLVATMVFLGFIFLYFLSRRGYSLFASYALLVIFFLPVTYQIYSWGVDIPMAILAYALIIFIASILINTRFSFFSTIIISFTIAIIAYLQKTKIIETNRYWIDEVWGTADVLMVLTMFLIIATVSWLSNREIEKSLARARRSEAELKKERDSLEITVEERTRELKETQAEKMTQLYRFAEFGRLSSGLFHDIINPLTAVSLNMDKVKNTQQSAYPHVEFAMQNTNIAPISETAMYLDKAIFAAKKMEDMVSAVRKQLSRQETKTFFSVNKEITQVLEVLSYKARKAGVAMRLFSRQEIKTYGDAIKFNQVALNLIVNAIDAYNIAGEVAVFLNKKNGLVIFEVEDKGIGISEENKPKLFEPFFTTKEEGYGLGIGLSITKRIVEKDFGGSVEVASKEGEGSVFTVKFPQRNKELTVG